MKPKSPQTPTHAILKPAFYVPWRFKWPMGILSAIFCGVLYIGTNHSYSSSEILHPLYWTWLDEHTPFLPWTIWIYLSFFIFIPTAYFLNRCVTGMNQHLYSFVAIEVVSCFVFKLYPTVYPRERYPLIDSLDGLTNITFNYLRKYDLPVNCCPSLHVGLATLIALGFLNDQRRYFPFMFIWAVLLACSTMTTKQHYFLDVLAGVGMALIFFYLFHYQRSHSSKTQAKDQTKTSTIEASDDRVA